MPEETSELNWADAADQERPSWADQVDNERESNDDHEENEFFELPVTVSTVNGNIKTVVEYKYNDKGQKVKLTRKYKIESRRFSKDAARRKQLQKFGLSVNDPPGPSTATTFVSEEIFMQFVNTSEDKKKQEQEDKTLSKIRQHLQFVNFIKTLSNSSSGDRNDNSQRGELGHATSLPPGGGSGKYIPPSIRGGGGDKLMGSFMPRNPRENEQSTVRVTNISEETKESDLQDLFKPFGPVQRIFLAKDKHTQQSKGFAFITFYNKDDAAKAIKYLCGYGYDHLILNVEWAKPSTK